MKTRLRFSLATVVVVLLCALESSAQTQATRTFISGGGDDVNPCSLTAPCRTFAGVITRTTAGGEIDVLDSAGFGGVTITKSISIVNRGAIRNYSFFGSATKHPRSSDESAKSSDVSSS
jgi:hypothetical protein